MRERAGPAGARTAQVMAAERHWRRSDSSTICSKDRSSLLDTLNKRGVQYFDAASRNLRVASRIRA